MNPNLQGTDATEIHQSASTDAHGNGHQDERGAILVVDDEASIRSLIGTALESWGYRVHLASGGYRAMEILDREAFNLILTDLMMQDGDGLTLLDWAQARQPGLPVVMVTAASDVGTAIDSMRRGASDYLLKPFDDGMLLRTIQRALNRCRKMVESGAQWRNLEQEVRTRTDMLRWAVEDLQRSHDQMLLTLGDALDLRDSETEGHSKRVTAYTIALARAMAISPHEIKVLAQGALLHDIGKIAIQDSILRKPGRLTEAERETMRSHCVLGYEMLCRIPFLADAAEIVLSHHERFDGSGYPHGLRGNRIPLGARIFAVADTLDAITSDRPYQKARSFAAAVKEIKSCSGTLFDPDVVQAFSRIDCDLWLKLRAESEGEQVRHHLPREISADLPGCSSLQRLLQ